MEAAAPYGSRYGAWHCKPECAYRCLLVPADTHDPQGLPVPAFQGAKVCACCSRCSQCTKGQLIMNYVSADSKCVQPEGDLDQLIKMQAALYKAFPECKDLNQDPSRDIQGFVPHLSLGQWRSPEAARQAAKACVHAAMHMHARQCRMHARCMHLCYGSCAMQQRHVQMLPYTCMHN